MEAHEAAAYAQFAGVPIDRTVGHRGVRESTILHSQRTQHTGARDTITKIVHYREWDGRLHPMAAHPGKVTSD